MGFWDYFLVVGIGLIALLVLDAVYGHVIECGFESCNDSYSEEYLEKNYKAFEDKQVKEKSLCEEVGGQFESSYTYFSAATLFTDYSSRCFELKNNIIIGEWEFVELNNNIFLRRLNEL